MAQINVLQLITGLDIGGAERLLLSTARRLNSNKYRIIVCYLKGKGSLLEDFKRFGISVIGLGMRNRLDFTALFKLVKLIKKERIGLVHTHLIHAHIIGRIAAKLAGVPIIISTEHNLYNRGRKYLLLNLIDRITTRFTDRMVAISEAVKDSIVESGRIRASRVSVIYNGIDTNEFKRISIKREGFPINPAPSVVGMVARLDSQKGHRYFLEAASQVVKDIPGVKFLVVGDGPLKEKLRTQTTKLGLSKDVIFTGPARDIPQILDTLDLFVLPSLWEGLPSVILEAMAAGKPVVATAVGGIPEIVKDGQMSLLVPPRDPDALAQAIIKLLQNKELAQRMGQAGRRWVKDHFTIDKTVAQTEEIYDSLITQKD